MKGILATFKHEDPFSSHVYVRKREGAIFYGKRGAK